MGFLDSLFGDHSTSVINTASFISSTTFNTLVTLTNSQTNIGTASQTQSVTLGTPSDVMVACLAHNTPESCQKLMSSNLTVSDLQQTATLTMVNSASITNDIITKLQTQLTAQIDQTASDKTDALGSALYSFVNAFNKASRTTTNSTSASNFVTQTFDLKSVTTLVNKVNSDQTMQVSITNANNASAIKLGQSVQISAVIDLLSSNTASASAIATMDAKSTQTASSWQQGLADYINSITGLIGGVLQSYTWAVVACVALVILMCCSSSAMFLMTGGQDTLKSGISAYSKK